MGGRGASQGSLAPSSVVLSLPALSPRPPQILLLAFLKLIDEGSHMVMLECPETVNTLLHEFLLWEPEPSPKALPEPLPTPPEEKK